MERSTRERERERLNVGTRLVGTLSINIRASVDGSIDREVDIRDR